MLFCLWKFSKNKYILYIGDFYRTLRLKIQLQKILYISKIGIVESTMCFFQIWFFLNVKNYWFWISKTGNSLLQIDQSKNDIFFNNKDFFYQKKILNYEFQVTNLFTFLILLFFRKRFGPLFFKYIFFVV